MKTILASALALGAMTSVAFGAEPAKAPVGQSERVMLTDAQMDNVTAGQQRGDALINVSDIEVQVAVQAICVAGERPGCVVNPR